MTGRADFARVARETLDYVLREMTAPEGGFYSATDADSAPDGEEGKFFVWSEAEIRQLLGDGAEAERFIRYYGVTAGGNFEGANILARRRTPTSDESRRRWRRARAALYAARAQRSPPLRDDKILAAWNGLTISAAGAWRGGCSASRATSTPRRAPATFVLDAACARAAGSRAASRTGAPGARRLPRRLRVRRARG